jgi:hypothetical protein
MSNSSRSRPEPLQYHDLLWCIRAHSFHHGYHSEQDLLWNHSSSIDRWLAPILRLVWNSHSSNFRYSSRCHSLDSVQALSEDLPGSYPRNMYRQAPLCRLRAISSWSVPPFSQTCRDTITDIARSMVCNHRFLLCSVTLEGSMESPDAHP